MDILTRSGSLRASVNPSDSSKCIRSVMQAGRLELHFSSSKPIPFALGDYADFGADRYTLCYPSEVSKVQREWLEYTLVLHSSAEELKQRLVKSPEGETKVDFVMVGSPTDHLRLITRAMGEGWSVGTSLEAGDRLVAYKSDTCYAALCRLAEEYKTEWVVKGKTISLRREELWRDAPVRMSYGKGKGFLSGVSRSGDGDKLPISRLYVVGGSRNIDPAAYGSRSLHLPDGSTALSSGVEGREAALDLSHIYPSRVGTVSEVVTVSEEKCFYDIKDDSIPAELNYSDCRIPGEKAVIRFQSGALAGRELEIRQSESALEGYHHEERRFELVPREEDGFTFPSPQWMPKAGDRYAVFGISLPSTYIKEAEERMLSEAKRYLEDNKEPVYTFRGEVDGIWARKHWLEVGGKLVPGGHVLFSDPEFHPSGSVIRIVSTTQAVNDPHAPSVTLSTAPVPGSFLSRLDRVEADEVVRREQIREVQRQQSQSYRQALEHLSMVDRAVEGLEGFTRRLKPSVLETMGILVGSQATQLDFVRAVGSLESVTPAINYDPDDKALHIGESVLRHQTIGITTMRDRRDPSEYRYWRLPEYVSPPLTDPDRSYYIYARAARVGSSGSFLLSEEPIPMEGDPDYFHLLIGTLSSLDGGDRAYNRLYGFSMISPGQMVVDTISSANGRMSIDLARGEIYASSVSFSRPDGARGSLSDLAGEVDELQSHPPKIVDGKWHVWDGKAQTYVNTGDTARGETGANGLAPKIVDGKWSVWDGSRWVSTGVPAQGPKGEQGAPGKDVDPKVLNDLKAAVDDARRKLDDTVTKAELDGVVSAQEEHDIQAAKAALDAAKKAYDDAVKRAKELDDQLQIGGRNLLLGTSKVDRRKGGYSVYTLATPISEPGKYILSFDCEVIRPPKGGEYCVIFGYRTTLQKFAYATYVEGATHYEVPIDVKRITQEGWASEAKDIYLYPNTSYVNPDKTPDCGEAIFSHVKLERGIVATDWTTAPEDLQAEIDAAKEQATKAQTSTDKLRGYVDGAFRDGVVDDAEAKAIKTYIQEVDAQWQSALGAYEKVYQNTLLTGTPKTALLDCKTTLAGKVSDLTGYIKTAISDGKATAAEVTETDRRYTAYKTALRDFQRALKVAEESIRDAGKTTGGRNLLLSDTSQNPEERVETTDYLVRKFPLSQKHKYERGEWYTLSLDVEVPKDLTDDERMYNIFDYNGRVNKYGNKGEPSIEIHNGRTHITFKWGDSGNELSNLGLLLYRPFRYNEDRESRKYSITTANCTLVKGTVGLETYTPAPEDVQAAIDKVERGYQKLIERVDVEFAVSSSRTTAPQSGWQTDAPTTTKGQVLWQRTKVYLKDGTTEVRGTTCIQGRDGTDGDNGADGRGIADVKEYYYLSTSNTELKGGVWRETAPTPKDGCWIWTMTRIYYTSGTPTITKPVCVTGAKGDPGAKGEKGDKGDKGDGLEVVDTRNDNQPPNWYRTKYPRTTVREFKYQSKIGIPSKWIYGSYCTLETTVRWADTSGGRVEQSTTLDNGVQLRRVGTADDTAWEPWINVSAEVAAVRKGLANTDTLVSALEKAQSKLDQGILTKTDIKDIQYLLDSLKNGDTQVAGGLVLSNDIILSDPNSRDVTATISGTQTQGANVMRLGISYTCDEDKKATVERAGAKWGINLSSILTGLESDSDRIRKLDELGFTIVGGRSLAWSKWEICKATDAKEGGEATALANDGTGHFGELYFWGESIGFGATDKRYMQIGGTARSEYDMVNASTVIRKFGISGGTVRKSGTFVLDRFDSRYSNREIKYTANLSAWAEARAYRVSDNGGWDPNDHRYHKPEYEEFVRTESSATVQLRLELTRGGSTIKTVTSPQVSVSVSAQGGQFGINEEIPQSALYAEDRKSQDVTITISPSDVREQDTVTLSLVTTIRRSCYHHQGNNEIDRYASATASAGSIINFLPYDTSQPMVSVTKDRAAFFYGRSKYVLLNYLRDCVMKVVGNMLLQGNLTLKGDLTAEYADFPGVPMIGGMVSEKCIFKKSFGRYKNRDGRNVPQVSYNYSSKIYTVYHSIGNDKYIPVVTPMDHRWGDTLSISNVSSSSFQVQLTNGNQDRNQCAFTYVCFKAD